MLCIRPSDQITVHGPVPERLATMFVLPPGQIVPPPLTVAVGRARLVMILAHVLPQPLALVSVRPKVNVPAAPALTLTVCAVVAPLNVALPVSDQR